jgi:ribonuclease E
VKGVENMAISFLRKVHAAAAKGTASEVHGDLPLEVAYYLLNRKKRELAQIENDYDIEVTIKGKPSFLMNQLELVVVKREKPAFQEQTPQPQPPVQSEIEVAVVVETLLPLVQAEESPADDGRPKKKRGSRKKVDAAEEELPIVAEIPSAEEAPETETLAVVEDENLETEPEEPKKKRRRKRRRKSKGSAAEQALSEAAEDAEEDNSAEEASETALDPEPASPEEGAAELHKKRKRRRRKRGGAKSPEAEAATPLENVEEMPSEALPVSEPVVTEEKPKKPRVRAPRKKELFEEVAILPVAEAAPETAKPKRVRAKKVVAEALTGIIPSAIDPVSFAESKPKPKRAPRKKKSDEVKD